MTTLVSDSFNRADSTTTLGNADTGQTWQYLNGSVWGISSNQAYSVDGKSDVCAFINSGYSDTIQIAITLEAFGSDDEQALYFWVTDINNWFRLIGVSSQSAYYLQQKSSGSVSTLKQFTGHMPTIGDQVQIGLSGGTVTVTLNGTAIGSVNTGTQSSTNHGFGNGTGSSPARFDNFSVTTSGGTTPTPITATGAFQGQGSLSAIANIVNPATINATASLTGQGSLTATANLISPVVATASMQGQGSLTATGNGVWFGSASLTGQGSLSSNPVVVLTASASLSGQGSLTAVVDLQDTSVIGTANFYGSSSVVSNPTVSKAPIIGSALFSGQGSLTATVEVIDIGVANLQGTSYLMANAVLPAQVQVPKVWNTVFDPKKSWTGVFDKTVHTWTGVFDPKKVWVGGE